MTLTRLCVKVFSGRTYENLSDGEKLIVDYLIEENNLQLEKFYTFRDETLHEIVPVLHEIVPV